MFNKNHGKGVLFIYSQHQGRGKGISKEKDYKAQEFCRAREYQLEIIMKP